jgi:hypothetical protein
LLQSAVKNHIKVTIITDERTLTFLNTKADYFQYNELLALEAKCSTTLLPDIPNVPVLAIHWCHHFPNEAEKTIT